MIQYYHEGFVPIYERRFPSLGGFNRETAELNETLLGDDAENVSVTGEFQGPAQQGGMLQDNERFMADEMYWSEVIASGNMPGLEGAP